MDEIPPSMILADLANGMRADDGTLREPSSADLAVVARLLSLVSREVEYRRLAIETRRRSLLDAIETTADCLSDDERKALLETVRRDVRTASGSATEIEASFARATCDVLAELNDLPPARRREARRPMYDHLERRANIALAVVGYSSVTEQTWEAP